MQRLIYTVDIDDGICEIDGIHNDLDLMLRVNGIDIKKSIFTSDGEMSETSEHDYEEEI